MSQFLFNAANAKLLSRSKEFITDLEKYEKKVRAKASVHLVKKIKAKAERMFNQQDTGRLIKGIKSTNGPDHSLVGAGPSAYHAHIFEFGTDQRFVKTSKGKALKKARATGSVRPRPFILPTFAEELGELKKILGEGMGDNV
jgi:hypothetical protein